MAVPENVTGGHVLCLMYIVFAFHTDGEFSEEEMKTIGGLLVEWGVEDPGTVMMETSDWISGMEGSDEQIGTMVAQLPNLKEKFGEKGCTAIVNDVIQIAESDGKYDDIEKDWVSKIANGLGIPDPNA